MAISLNVSDILVTAEIGTISLCLIFAYYVFLVASWASYKPSNQANQVSQQISMNLLEQIKKACHRVFIFLLC